MASTIFYRFFAFCGIVAFGAVSLLSGSDRRSTLDIYVPSYVGWPFDAGAALSHAAIAARNNDWHAAALLGPRLVIGNPIDTQVLGLYGTILAGLHRTDDARQAYALAARLGWRDEATQQYWFTDSMVRGDAKLAAVHLDGLLRAHPENPSRNAFLHVLLQYEEGRTALADQLRAEPSWARSFVTDIDGLDADDLAARADVVVRTGRLPDTGDEPVEGQAKDDPSRWDCYAIAGLVNGLAGSGLPEQAAAVHDAVCGAGGGIVRDGNFERLRNRKPASILDWGFIQRGDATLAFSPVDVTPAQIDISLASAGSLPVLGQVTTAGPGSYQVAWSMPRTSLRDAAGLKVTYGCDLELADALDGMPIAGRGDRRTASFVVPDGCDMPVLQFWLSPGHTVTLAGIEVHPVPAQR